MTFIDFVNKIDSFTQKHFHWKLIPIIEYSLQLGVSLYILSSIYNTIFQYKIQFLYYIIPIKFDFTINPLMYLNPIFWHLNQGFHHTWDLLALLGFFFLMIYAYKIPTIISAFNLVFIVSFHEMLWFITYTITHVINETYFQVAWVFSPIQISYITVILTYFYLMYKTKRYDWFPLPILFLSITTITFIYWGAGGFPITVDFLGITQYWLSYSINTLEIFAWILPITMYGFDILVKSKQIFVQN